MFELVALLLGSAHGFYLSYAIYHKDKTLHSANGLLALFVFCFAVLLLFILINSAELVLSLPFLFALDEPIKFLFGPLLYLYTKKLTTNAAGRFATLHFLPFGLASLICIPFFVQSNDFKLTFFTEFELSNGLAEFYAFLFDWAFMILPMVQLFVYVLLISKRINEHHTPREGTCMPPKGRLLWLKRLNLALVGILSLWFFDEILNILAALCEDNQHIGFCQMGWLSADRAFYFSEVAIVICIYLISLYGLKQPQIYSAWNGKAEKATGDVKPASEKYQHSVLTDELSQSLYDDVLQQLESTRAYLEPDLTLERLVKVTGYSRHHLSQAINQCAEKNFSDFINFYRIEWAKVLLSKGEKKSIEQISLDAGFNSRTAFYSAFKKQLNMTPSQFRNQRIGSAS